MTLLRKILIVVGVWLVGLFGLHLYTDAYVKGYEAGLQLLGEYILTGLVALVLVVVVHFGLRFGGRKMGRAR